MKARTGPSQRTVLFAAAWTLLILVLCALPGEDVPEVDIIAIDKLVHLILFAVFGILWLRSAGHPTARTGFSVVVVGIAFGIATELFQEWLDWGRTMDVWDAVADSIGVFCVVGWELIRRYRLDSRESRF